VKPAPFRYIAAHSLDEALAQKAEHGDEARFLAGGQSLVPAMNFRLAQPAVLIDLNAVAELDYVQRDDRLHIGALTRHRRLELARAHPLLDEAMPHVGHWQIRTRGTIGGNLAHADPASELPAVMLAVQARIQVRSARSDRRIAAADFFTGPLATVLHEDEMLAEVTVPPLPPRTGTCFMEIARRRGDYAMMGVAAVVTLAEDGRCAAARLAYLSAGPTPMPAPKAAASLVGHRLDEAVLAEAAALAQGEIDPCGSVQATPAYQRHLAGVLTRRAVRAAAGRAA
jgi:carbon-monoxide dehydrogenase medium subunit